MLFPRMRNFALLAALMALATLAYAAPQPGPADTPYAVSITDSPVASIDQHVVNHESISGEVALMPCDGNTDGAGNCCGGCNEEPPIVAQGFSVKIGDSERMRC